MVLTQTSALLSNALTAEETDILAQCHWPEFADLPPDQIVVRLMNEEWLYLASVSSFIEC